MFTTTLDIKGTFDIAMARHRIRTQLASNQHILPRMYLRINIALTALGELIISMMIKEAVPVQIQIVQHDSHYYLEYYCSIPNSSVANKSSDRYQSNLEKISHNFEILTKQDNLQIEGNIQLDGQ